MSAKCNCINDAEFIRNVVYFWQTKGDPSRYAFWDALRCERLMPAFYEAWRKQETYKLLADMAARRAETDLND